jgi:hypothetical protein
MRRFAVPVVAVVALLLLALAADASVAPAVRHARRGAASSSPLSRARGPAVDMRAQGVNATWFSVCVSSSPSAPVVPPLPSPLAEPVIDAKVAATPLALKKGLDKGCVAWGFHNDDIETLGWSERASDAMPTLVMCGETQLLIPSCPSPVGSFL